MLQKNKKEKRLEGSSQETTSLLCGLKNQSEEKGRRTKSEKKKEN
jgi:hypothetical protein